VYTYVSASQVLALPARMGSRLWGTASAVSEDTRVMPVLLFSAPSNENCFAPQIRIHQIYSTDLQQVWKRAGNRESRFGKLVSN
jgi:hypothetical protein